MLALGVWLIAAAGFDYDDALERDAYSSVVAEAQRAGSESTPAQLALLIAAQRTGRIELAETTLAALTERGVDLGSLAMDLRVWIEAARGRCAEVEPLAAALETERSVHASPAWARAARCWARAGELDAAQKSAERFGGLAGTRGQRAAAALMMAELFIEAERPEDAVPLLRQLLRDQPHASQAPEAEALLAALRRRGHRDGKLSPIELVAQADAERADQRLAAARRAYEKILKTTKKKSAAALSAELGLVEIDMVNRLYARAQERVERVLADSQDDAVSARALYLQGDILSRRKSTRQALESYARLRQDYPTDPFAVEGTLAALRLAYGARQLDEVHTLAAWILEHAPGVRQAGSVVADDGVHRDTRGLGTARDHALWMLAWLGRREGRPPEEMDSYLQAVAGDGPYALDGIYWRLRLAQERGDREAAEVFAEMLGQREPISFAALAARDLMDSRQACLLPRPDAPADVERPALAARDLRGPIVFFEQGLPRAARELLRSIPATGLSWDDRVAAAWLYRRCGDLHLGTMLARRAAATAKQEVIDPALLELAFPRPFTTEVKRHSSRYGVPEELIYAIMREESAFNPMARSPRAARGLMQMIPQTARAMADEARALDDKPPQRHFRLDKLYEPDVAIQLGVVYLRSLLVRFDGNLIATIAAYHAGENAVERWLSSRGQLPADEFIEEIPFSSTRGYVKHVLAVYAVYRLTYGGQADRAFSFDLAAGPALEAKIDLPPNVTATLVEAEPGRRAARRRR